MTYVLPPDLAEFVNGCVASGKYTSVDDAVEAGLRYLQARDRHEAWLMRELQKGLDDLANGRYVELKDEADIERFFDEIKENARTKLAAQSSQDELQPKLRNSIDNLNVHDYIEVEQAAMGLFVAAARNAARPPTL